MGKNKQMSYKNTISMGKTCRYLKRDIWEKPLMSYKSTIIYGENKQMSYKNTISMGKNH